MSTTRFVLAAFFLLLSLTFLGQGSSCKEDSKRSKANSSNPPANQVHSTANKQQGTAVPEGLWGGAGIRMQVTQQGAEIEYDCAHGTISERLRLDSDGRFRAAGTHLRDRPGPIRLGETRKGQPASYIGTVKGETMTLEVTLTAESENIGSFTLTKGREGRLRKCL